MMAQGYLLAMRVPMALNAYRHFLERWPEHKNASRAQAAIEIAGIAVQKTLREFDMEDSEFELLVLHDEILFEISCGEFDKYRAAQTTALGEAETARAHEQARRLVNSVRGSWFETYYQARAVDILRVSHTLLSQLLQITRTQYSTGLTGAQDLLNAELELRQIKERITATETAHETARAELIRWLGHPRAPRVLAEEFPLLALPTERAVIEAHLDEHPLMAAEAAMVRASDSEVNQAREQYKPGWEVDVGYGARGGGRTDYISAGVTLELPLFADKRQDRRLAASKQQAIAASYARDDQRRELLHRLESGYAAWTGLGKRLAAYEKEIVPQAAQNAELALKAYQNNSVDFTSVMRAQLTGQEVQLQALRVRVDHAKAQADLLYFAGEAS